MAANPHIAPAASPEPVAAPARQPLHLLLVEDSPDDAALLLRTLERAGYDVTCERVDTAAAMRAALQRERWDLVVSDYVLPQFSGLEAVAVLRDSGLDLPFIMISGAVGEETAVAAMKAGAHDFVTKGNLTRLVPAIEREMREARVRRERAQIQEQLRRSQKLDTAGRIAAGMAHEFNNQLTVIKGSVQFLLASLRDSDPRRRDAERISGAVDRGARLIRQLLAFGRAQQIELRTLNVNDLLTEMAPMLRLVLGARIRLELQPEPSLWTIRADPLEIEQVITNLVLNARDAIIPHSDNGDGVVRLATANTELDLAAAVRLGGDLQPGAYVALRVADNGSGMAPEVQAHIFEPFFTTKPVGTGSGLGLATSFGIVRQHHGSMACQSTHGRGTMFTVYLPRCAGTSEDPPPARAPAAPVHATTSAQILVAEDEPAVQDIIQRALSGLGHTVHVAADPHDAWRVAAVLPRPPDLLVSDVVMPGGSGPQLATELRQRFPTLRVLFVSGYADAPAAAHAVPGARFLHKPFAVEDLLRSVRELLESAG